MDGFSRNSLSGSLLKSVHKIQILFKSDKDNKRFTRRPSYIYEDISTIRKWLGATRMRFLIRLMRTKHERSRNSIYCFTFDFNCKYGACGVAWQAVTSHHRGFYQCYLHDAWLRKMKKLALVTFKMYCLRAICCTHRFWFYLQMCTKHCLQFSSYKIFRRPETLGLSMTTPIRCRHINNNRPW